MNDYLLILLDCNDNSLQSIMTFIKNTLNVIHIVVPILLIVMASINLAKMLKNPDDKKGISKIKNIFIAAIVVFFIPTFLDVLMSSLGENTTISSCWESSNYTPFSSSYYETEEKDKQKLYNDPDEYEKGEKKQTQESTTGTGTTGTGSSSTDGTKTPSQEDMTSPTGTGKYGPALKGSGFSISGASTTGGCASGGQQVVHDLSIGVGNPVYAGMDGTIQFIQYVCNGVLFSYGNQARLTDSSTGTYILYGHLSQFVGASNQVTKTCHEVYGKSAKCGYQACSSGISKNVILTKQVKRGELIGYTGNTGNSEGPHLHVEIHENGSSSCITDPYAAMGMR